jgi:AcrR family transcriptional regulator
VSFPREPQLTAESAAATGRRPPQQQRSREKVERILAVTARLLEEQSPEELNTKVIAAEAGVSIGALYRFFPDKGAIFQALVRYWLDAFVELLDSTLAEEPLPADLAGLCALVVGRFADFFRHEPGFQRLWYSGLKVGDHADSEENDRQLADRLHAVLNRRYRIPDTGETRQRVLLAVGIADLMLHRAFREDPAGDPAILAEAALAVTRYLEPDQAR